MQSRRVCQTTGLQTQVPRTSEDGEPVRRRSFNNILEKAADFASERERERARDTQRVASKSQHNMCWQRSVIEYTDVFFGVLVKPSKLSRAWE